MASKRVLRAEAACAILVSMGPGEVATSLDRIVQHIDERLSPAAILLFGSRATHRDREASDFDVAILVDHGSYDAFAQASLATELEAILGRHVDLIFLNDASPIVGMEVLRGNRPLLVRDAEALESFTVRTVMMYDDLKRVRAPIEQALLRGRDS